MFKHVIQITGFLAACVGLYAWYTAPTAGLEADVYSAEFELPSAIAQQIHALAPLAAPEEARGVLKQSMRERFQIDAMGMSDQMLNRLATYANEHAPILRHKSDFTFKGYWKVRIRNSGSKSASSVTLHFPLSVSGVVSRPHADATPVQEQKVSTTKAFSLGNILPGEDEEVIVYAWSSDPPSDDLAKKITLTHDVGVGRVKLLR